jgi:hypothetical protein
LHSSNQGKQRIAEIVTGLFFSLNTYGKDASALKVIIPLFMKTLENYTLPDLEWAFAQYTATETTFPSPANIVQLIENKDKPKLIESIYVNLSMRRQNDPENLSKEEWTYIREYEASAMKGIEYGSKDSRSAMIAENERLRIQVKELQAENFRLGKIVKTRQIVSQEVLNLASPMSKEEKTLQWMKDNNFPIEDIIEFQKSFEKTA